MKRDKRGRVRFTHNRIRYEFNSCGDLTVYWRDYQAKTEKPYFFMRAIPGYKFVDPSFRAKLREALDAMDGQQFTTDIFIPQSMRAVND